MPKTESKNLVSRIVQAFFPPSNAMPGGDVLQKTTSATQPTLMVENQDTITLQQPYGTIDPSKIKGRSSGWSQVQNLSANLDVAKVQAAFRAAERGDTTLLFGYYRDLFISTGIVATEVSKRKLAVIGEPFSILPYQKGNADDEHAAEVILDMINNCPNWLPSLVHLMNAIIFPISISEKIFRPVEAWETNEFGLRYYLKELHPVDYVLVNYRLPYLPQGPINPGGIYPVPSSAAMGQPWFYTQLHSTTTRPEDTIYDQDSWEPDLRLWHVFNNGLIDYSWSNIYQLDPMRHMVYRCNLLNGIARDNFGGLGRAVLFWAIMSQLGREFFLRLMDRYGIPFISIHADTAQKDTMDMLENALGMATKLNAIVTNKDAVVDIKEISIAGAADGHEKFLQFCNDQVSLLISGQTLGSHAKSTGLGSGVAALQGQVRSDIVAYDRQTLSTVLRDQLFRQFLTINNVKGNPPKISWGAHDDASSMGLSKMLLNLKQAGLKPTEDAISILSDKVGFELESFEAPSMDAFGKPIGNSFGDNKENPEDESVEPSKEENVVDKN